MSLIDSATRSLGKTKLWFPEWAQPLFAPHRFKVAKGGRGSSKSWTVAQWLVLAASDHFERVLCAREIQKSIKDSSYKLLVDTIDRLGLKDKFVVTKNSIVCPFTGSEFLFAGLKTNVDSIKSMEGLTKVWVEEAHKVSLDSWRILIPTVRAPGSEIIVTFNPDEEEDATSQMFIENAKKLPDCVVMDVNFSDNPWFPDVLRAQMEYDFAVDADAAENIWNGKYRKRSKAQIFSGKYVVEGFEPQDDWIGPMYGGDHGFAQDPATLVKVWLDRTATELYVEYAEGGTGLSNDNLADMYRLVPGSMLYVKTPEGQLVPADQQFQIRADCSRPETNNELALRGFNVQGCQKWPGCVEDGVQWMRSLRKITVHPRCVRAADEFKFYSWKVDKVTNEVQPIIVDKWNHYIDAIRYALEPFILGTAKRVLVTQAPDLQAPIQPELDEWDAMMQRSSW
jgi:phage terminase large subunit